MAAIRELTSNGLEDSSLSGLREFLDGAGQPAAVSKGCGRLVLANSEFVDLLPELKAATFGNKISLLELVIDSADESCRGIIAEQLDEAIRLASTSCMPEQRLLRRCSKESLHITISPQVRENSKPVLLWILRDVGKDHRLEERDEHSKKMQTLTRFAGGMAHEFNNLLTAILGNLELMRVRPEQTIEAAKGHIESAEIAALRASALIQELRRFGTREIPLREAKSVPRSIRRARRILSGTVSRNIEITHGFEDEDQLYALINADQLEEALLKLGVNSAEAIGSAAGKIQINAGSFEDESGKPVIRIDITDSGRGMCKQTREQAFEPLFTTKDDAKAAGLGMSIAHGLIEEMGGYVRISDTSDKGSVVSVFLPRLSAGQIREDESSVKSGFVPELRIATLDDEHSVRNVVSGMLSLLGHTVQTFADGEELIKAFQSGERFDMVLIDHVMPGMTGRGTYLKIREIDSNVPVVISSGKGIDITRFCPECTVQPNAFLKKPFTMEELAAVISSLTVNEYQI